MVRALVVLLLTLVAAKLYFSQVFTQPGLDFYHFWGVPAALELSGHRLGSPYARGEQYAQVLNDHAGTVLGDEKLARVNRERRTLDLTGSPLLYTAFAVLPKNYSTALGLFRGFEVVLFLVAVALLGSAYHYAPFLSATLGLTLLIAADPYKNDLSLGNIDILLLCGLAGGLAMIENLPGRPAWRRLTFSSGVLAGLACLTLLKPLVLLPCLFLAIGLCRSQSKRSSLASSGIAWASTLALVLLPCLYFGSWTVWSDWYQAVYGADQKRLFYPVEQGNFSFMLLASDRLGVRYVPLAAGLGTLLLTSLLLVATPGRRPEGTGQSVAIWDPHLLVSLGVLATFALSPLAWVHYYMLLLIPALWLGSLSAQSMVIAFLGLTALAMSSGAADYFLLPFQRDTLIPWLRALSWLPAWIGILLVIRAGTRGIPVEAPIARRHPGRLL